MELIRKENLNCLPLPEVDYYIKITPTKIHYTKSFFLRKFHTHSIYYLLHQRGVSTERGYLSDLMFEYIISVTTVIVIVAVMCDVDCYSCLEFHQMFWANGILSIGWVFLNYFMCYALLGNIKDHIRSIEIKWLNTRINFFPYLLLRKVSVLCL